MDLCFRLPPFRDRDLWPLARTALLRGHRVYYSIAGKGGLRALVAQDRRTPFDLVVSAEGALPEEDCARLRKKPRRVELIFNGLIEIAGRFLPPRPRPGEGTTLALMDRALCSATRQLGFERSVFLPYGVVPFRYAEPGYYPRRLGRRASGWLVPEDLARPPGALARLGARFAGQFPRARRHDVVFLGECKLGPRPELLSGIRSRFLVSTPQGEVEAIERRMRSLLQAPQLPAAATFERELARALDSLPGDAPARTAKALLGEHYQHQYRTARRLHLVRGLKAALGARFRLYGDDFRALGVDAAPTSHGATEAKYLSAKIALDFGSNSYDTTLYTRSVRIVACESLLLQLRQPDASAALGGVAPLMTFETADAMLERVEHFLASPQRRTDTSAALSARASSGAGMDHAVKALEQLR